MKMQYAIEMFFDEETEKKLFSLAHKIADTGISTKYLEWKTRPHLTLACFSDVDEGKCVKLLKEFAMEHKVLPAYIGSVGMFTDTKAVYVVPIMNSMMYDFQRQLHEKLRGFDTKGWEWYLPDRWVPHCAVGLMNEDSDEAFYKASDLVLHEFEKLCGEFVSVGLVKISFPVEEIYTVNLTR